MKIVSVVLLLLLVLWAIIVYTPKTSPNELLELKSDMIIVDGSSIKAVSPVQVIHPQILGMKQDYEMSEMLICLWENESSFGTDMYGDYRNGIPMAYGHFQIWISLHPVTYECAMDLSCSAQYVIEQIELGNGRLWTPYEDCLSK